MIRIMLPWEGVTLGHIIMVRIMLTTCRVSHRTSTDNCPCVPGISALLSKLDVALDDNVTLKVDFVY